MTADTGPLSIAETALVVTQLAKALGEAHALGIVHRDVKPDNVFLMSSGDETFVKVLDFGIAKQADRTQGEHLAPAGRRLAQPLDRLFEITRTPFGQRE